MENLANLNDEEKDLMFKAPAYVTILIAGVDENIEKSETAAALAFADFLASNQHPLLDNYYKEVNKQLKANLVYLLEKLPFESQYRNVDIAIELEKLNLILPKLEKKFAQAVYHSLLIFAKHIAESSGGFLSFGAISAIEKKWIKLDMIEEPV